MDASGDKALTLSMLMMMGLVFLGRMTLAHQQTGQPN
jgi:hypothetical protein